MKNYFGYSKNVFVLSLVSFLNDIGGETIKRTIPLFLANVLRVPTSIIGLVEGIGEASPQLLQPLSGLYSDKLKRRKIFVVIGQLLRASMLALFFAVSWWHVLLIRFLDRSGKGIATSPRDALLSVSADQEEKGKAFGLNRALDNAGAVIGLAAAGLVVLLVQRSGGFLEKNTFSLIILLAAVPLAAAFFIVLRYVQDIPYSKTDKQKIVLTERLNPAFYRYLAVSFLFTLGNSSDGFLLLRAQNVGIHLAVIFFLFAGLSLVSSLISVPAGELSDRIGRKKVLLAGWLLYSVVYFGFGRASNTFSIIALFPLYGLYYGISEAAAKAYVSDLVPERRRGTAYGLYNLVVGATLLPSSLLAGFLWQAVSPAAPFYFGSAVAVIAAIGLWILLKE